MTGRDAFSSAAEMPVCIKVEPDDSLKLEADETRLSLADVSDSAASVCSPAFARLLSFIERSESAERQLKEDEVRLSEVSVERFVSVRWVSLLAAQETVLTITGADVASKTLAVVSGATSDVDPVETTDGAAT